MGAKEKECLTVEEGHFLSEFKEQVTSELNLEVIIGLAEKGEKRLQVSGKHMQRHRSTEEHLCVENDKSLGMAVG